MAEAKILQTIFPRNISNKTHFKIHNLLLLHELSKRTGQNLLLIYWKDSVEWNEKSPTQNIWVASFANWMGEGVLKYQPEMSPWAMPLASVTTATSSFLLSAESPSGISEVQLTLYAGHFIFLLLGAKSLAYSVILGIYKIYRKKGKRQLSWLTKNSFLFLLRHRIDSLIVIYWISHKWLCSHSILSR